ncbi:hypothetical protein HK104_009273 [Borealophlyctis nickersoniae]|nr:hypothetical protein HK104_009273 [Borealophlyctis nickersoniae]
MGGDPGALTLANLMKQFRPDLVGASLGTHGTELCYGVLCFPFQYKPEQDQFNAAQSGAVIINLQKELDWLVWQMRQKKGIDFQNDYKLLNIFIGSNDACLGCHPVPLYPSPDTFETLMRSLFEDIRQRVPRVVVNIMQQFNVSQVYDLTHKDPWCAGLRNAGLILECTCAFMPGPNGPTTRELMDTLVVNYNQRLSKIAAEYRNPSRADYNSFALVLDPVISNVKVRDWPIEFLSDVDCFHPGIKAHETMATSVWNNLFRPLDEKTSTITPGSVPAPVCPTADSRVKTT